MSEITNDNEPDEVDYGEESIKSDSNEESEEEEEEEKSEEEKSEEEKSEKEIEELVILEQKSKQKLGLLLGDIIHIYNKSRPELNKVFLIDYIDEEKIKIVSDDSKYILTINKDQTIDDKSIENIDLLYRNPLDGYALQNGLLPTIWITIYFDGDYTSSVTGEITNLEQDMIEITTFPNKDIIYIDFSYKGLPEGILHIRITEPPSEYIEPVPQDVLQDVPQDVVKSLGDNEIDTDEQDYLILKKDFKEFEIKPKYIEADNIRFGNYMDEVEDEYIVDAKYKRYSLEEQTNDMLDELLSKIPEDKRTRNKLNAVNTIIERYVQLLKEFSLYDDDKNIISAEKKGSNFRPLVKSLNNFKKSLYWIIPVAKNEKKNLLDEEDLDKDETMEQIKELKLIVDTYKSLDSENTHEIFLRRLQSWFVPFSELDYNDTGNIIVSKQVKDNFNVMINNLGNYQSKVVKCKEKCDFSKSRLFMNYIVDSHPDQMFLESLITLPEPIVRYSRVNMPGTNIMSKSNISRIFINYTDVLKIIKKKNVTYYLRGDCLIDTENKIDAPFYQDKLKTDKDGNIYYATVGFLNNTKNYCLDMELVNRDSKSNLFEEYLNCIIPKTIQLFHLMKKYIRGKLSIYDIISTLEPFLIYSSDISFQQYVEMAKFLDDEVSNYIKSYVSKTNAYQALKTQNNNKAVNKIATIFINKRDFYNSVIENVYGYNEDYSISGIELLKNISRLDYGNVFNYALRQYSSSLNNTGVGKKIVDDLEMFLTKVSNESECKTLRFAKRYYTIDILNSDNNKEIYYDKEFDKTPYSIIDDYEKERQQMNDEKFYELILEKLKSTVSEEDAPSILESIKQGRKRVENMDYAIIYNQTQEKLDYYVRKNDVWEYDEILDQPISDELACILRDSCSYQKNECISTEATKDEIYEYSMKKIVNEFDKKYEKTLEENKNYTTQMLKYYTKCISKIKEIHKYKLLKYSIEHYKLGLSLGEIEVKQSPYNQLRDMILGQPDIIKKYESIISFAKKYTVEKAGDDIHWLYCVETDVPLLPKFYYTLAKTFIDTPEDYTRRLDLLCSTNGKKSDDGDKYVDKYSGYTIRVIDFVKEYGETEDFEEEITEPEKKTTNILEKRILNIVKTMESNMRINVEDEYPFILTTTTQAYNSANISEAEFNEFISKHTKKTDKTYHNYINTNLLLLTLGVFFITLQTMPDLKIKYSFPGCKKSFSGYPLTNEDDNGIEYIACIASKIKSSIEPWNVLKGKKDVADVSKIKKDLKKMIETNLINNLEIKDRIFYRTENKVVEIDAGEHSVSNWLHFLPAIIPFHVKEILPLSETFKSNLLRMIKTGDSKQQDSIEAIESKIILYAYSFQMVIQTIISKKTLLLTNSQNQPFIDNGCCNEKTDTTTFEYFNAENNRVGALNVMIGNLSELLKDIHKLTHAKTLFSDINTKNSVYISSNLYNKDVIVKVLMFLNKYATFTDSQEVYQKKMNEKVEEGVLFTTEEFIQKLKIIGNEQRVIYKEMFPKPTDFRVLFHDELTFKTETELNNFLQNNIEKYSKEIREYIFDSSRFKSKSREMREIEEILQLNWKNVETTGFYNNIYYLKNMNYLFSTVFPFIILNKERHDISISPYWGLTKTDSIKVKSCVDKYYADVEAFFGESKNFHDNISSILKRTEKYYHLSKMTQTIEDGVFGKHSSLLLQKYYLLSILKEYTNVENDVDEDDLLISGKKKTTNTKMSKLIRVFLDVMKVSKKTQNIQAEEIMERVFLLKEKEKETFTERLEGKDEYEREVDNVMKEFGLGDWGIGNKKSLYKYSKNDENDTLKEKIALAEERLLQNADVNSNNLEQYMDDEIQELEDNIFMDNEDNNLSGIHEDYCNDFEEDDLS